MARPRFEPDMGGYHDVLDSGWMQGILDDAAEGISEAATGALSPDWGKPPEKEHFKTGEFTTRTGSKGRYVRTVTEHAKRAESAHKVLTKALRNAGV